MIRVVLCFVFIVNFLFSLANKIDTIQIQAYSEGFLLKGILLKKSTVNKKIPVIIFLVGSGGSSTYATDYKNFITFFLEENFLNNGYALVYFDKRGVGGSEGVWYNTTFEERAIDAKSVALEVKKNHFVDHQNIFLIGHSQGGWIAQIALAEFPETFAGAISMAGPSFGVKKQLVNDYQNKFICEKGFDENKALRKATGRVNREMLFISIFGIKGNLKQLNVIKNFEAAPYLKKVNKPLLMLFAENDALVNLKWSLQELEKIFPKGLHPTIEVYEAKGETHAFKIAPKCYDSKENYAYSERTKQVLFKWLEAQKQ